MRLPSPLFLIQSTIFVIPAKAGIHFDFKHIYLKPVSPIKYWAHKWIPACAGMTV
jgi:hypothetical protein